MAISLDAALVLTPLAREQCRALIAALPQGALDGSTIDLCRQRVATLLRCDPGFAVGWVDGGSSPEKLAALPAWPTDPRFDDRERAALAFTEQFVIDPSGVTDSDAAEWRTVLSDPELVALTTAVAVFDALARTQVALEQVAPEAVG
jgi:alkylhydroperoxidase family enzyme